MSTPNKVTPCRGIIIEQFGSVEVSTQLTSVIYESVIGILHLKTDIKNPCLFPLDVATVGYTRSISGLLFHEIIHSWSVQHPIAPCEKIHLSTNSWGASPTHQQPHPNLKGIPFLKGTFLRKLESKHRHNSFGCLIYCKITYNTCTCSA